MSEPTFHVTFLTGEMTLNPVECRVVPYTDGPWWWRQKLWAVENDFMRWPGFHSAQEARAMATMMTGPL